MSLKHHVMDSKSVASNYHQERRQLGNFPCLVLTLCQTVFVSESEKRGKELFRRTFTKLLRQGAEYAFVMNLDEQIQAGRVADTESVCRAPHADRQIG